MKKTMILAAFVLLLAAQMAIAAGGGQQGSAGGAGKVVTIDVWCNDAHNRQEREAAVDAFNRGEGARRGINLNYRVFGGDYWTVQNLALESGDEPHIFKELQWPQRIQESKILPLTDLPQWYHAEIDKYKPYMIEGTNTFDGVVYNLPFGGTVYGAVAYNPALVKSAGFDAPPKTWAEFERACIEVARRNPGKFGAVMPLAYANYWRNNMQPVWIRSLGHTYFDFTAGRYRFADLAEYFEVWQRIIAGGGIFPGYETLTDDQARAQFSEGNIAFITTSPSYNVGVFYDQFPAKVEWSVMEAPLKDPNVSYKNMGSAGQSYAIGNKVKKENVFEQAARAYVALFGDETMISLYSGGKDIPKLPELIQRAQPSSRPQWNDTARINLGSVAVPVTPDEYFPVEGDDIRTSLSKILVGGNAREILTDMDRRFNAAFEQAVSRGTVKRDYFIRPNFQNELRAK